MSSLLFNAPIWIIIAVALLGLIILYMAMTKGQNSLRNYGFGFLGLALLLVIFRMTIVTDEKKVELLTRDLVTAFNGKDWPKAKLLTKSAMFYDMNGDQLMAHAEHLSEQYSLQSVSLNSIEVTKNPIIISSKIGVTSHHKHDYFENLPSNWTFEYQKRPQGWVLTLITFDGIGALGDKSAAERVLQGK